MGERAKQLWAQLWDKQPESGEAPLGGGAQEATAEVHNSGTLMAESSLADAILQENQQATAVSGQAVTGSASQTEQATPEESGEDEQAQPIPQPTQSPAAPEITENPVPQEPEENEGSPEVVIPQESLNPDTQENANPQEVPAQGPSIADIEAQQTQPVSYVIQPGDTLIGISTRQYGNDSHVQAICELNGIANPDNIQIGQKILLP